MSRYRVQYSTDAENGLSTLSRQARDGVKQVIAGTVGRHPYGCGSVQVGGDRDRRDATIGSSVFIRYTVSSTVLVVTVTRTIAYPG